MVKVNKKYKDRSVCMVFNRKEDILSGGDTDEIARKKQMQQMADWLETGIVFFGG